MNWKRAKAGRWAFIHLKAAKACFDAGNIYLGWHWLNAAAVRWVERDVLTNRPDDYTLHLRDSWSRCPFCKRRNGKFGRPLEQHGPRCRYKGPADALENEVPNHSKMIDEDDLSYLVMLRSIDALRKALSQRDAAFKLLPEEVVEEILNPKKSKEK